MMRALDERGTPWRNKTETDGEKDDAREYVAARPSYFSITNGPRENNHFSLSVPDITISIVPRSVYDLALRL